MLAAKYLELLTAYVDGELSPRRQRQVLRLLRKSPEARALLRKLQADSNSLINLSAPPPAPDVGPAVLLAITQRGLTPSRPAVVLRPPTVPLWRVLTAAAAVLVLAGAGSYLFFSSLGDPQNPGPVAHQRKKEPASQSTEQIPPRKATTIDSEVVQKPPVQKPTTQPSQKGTATEVVRKPDPPRPPVHPAPQPTPPEPEPGPIATAPGMGVFNPFEVEVALPSLFRLRELSQEKERSALERELSHHGTFQVELLCREATHAFARLQAALQAAGVEVIVDGAAQTRLKNAQFPANYLIYLDNLTPAELARLLAPLGQEDPKADRKKPAFGQFTSPQPNLIVCPMTPEQRKRLAGAIGIEAPVASTAKGKERSALVLMHGTSTRTPSAEVKRFVEGRTTPRKDAVEVFLVLRCRP